ncbi:MAG TPA: FAD:protein FMN transferase, partial [Pseudomonadales bacterium]
MVGVLLGCMALGACGGPGYFTLEGATMGTYYRITALCPGGEAEAMAQRVETTLQRVNGQMSTYLPDSELSRLNQAPVGVWLPASDSLREVISAALKINGMSDGAFDVTVGPLVNLWGFGPDGNITQAPSQAAIDNALERTSSRYLELDEKQGALLKQRALYIDLSAIAKGYGVDQVAEALMQAGCRDQLVDIGGEVAARGRNPGGRFWQIGIEVPDPERFGAVERIVPLDDMAVATSGDY